MYVPKSAPSPSTVRPLPSAPDRMQFWTGLLPRAMESFKKQRPVEPKGRPDSGQSIRSLTSWEQVHERIRTNRQGYDNPQGRVGTLKRGIRSVMDKSQSLRGVVNCIPDNDYLAPVVGTLGIILDAAKKATSLRQEVAAGLDSLEKHFEDIEAFLMTFPNDENIVNGSVMFLSSMLKAIEDVIGYYMRNTMSKAVAALIQQDDYQASLTASLEEMTSSGQALLKEAEKSNFWQTRKTWEATEENSGKLDQMNMQKLHQVNIHLTAQVTYYRERTPSPSRSPVLATHYTQSTPSIQREILEAELHRVTSGVRESQSIIDNVMQCRERLPRTEREAAERVVTAAKFREWLASPVSRELLIHGNFQGTQYTSSSSSSAGGRAGKGVGNHPEAPSSCGGYMIRSLLAQLLAQHRFNIEQIPTRQHAASAQTSDIHYLLNLFTALIAQLARSGRTVFCLIDGIKYYEREEYLEDMSLVLRCLLDTRENSTEAGGMAFKLLITSPSPTTIVRQAFHPDDVLSLGAVQPSGQGLSPERLRRQLGWQDEIEASE
ncbi:hypothetical protein B0H67DRAFT_497390 [Lasiosphaeris hirsuta]|uniref:Fungal STAND N-terminal Goodbye domain-containing protein n=1 Tax=Lasiosphaeris hirsuta TaxID=260670 RepID=A0AA39ZVH8_9PEZI|nr:hypothetical protein B0H67DRAFT_497390 [Lasiosphaeris hirsuta]